MVLFQLVQLYLLAFAVAGAMALLLNSSYRKRGNKVNPGTFLVAWGTCSLSVAIIPFLVIGYWEITAVFALFIIGASVITRKNKAAAWLNPTPILDKWMSWGYDTWKG